MENPKLRCQQDARKLRGKRAYHADQVQRKVSDIKTKCYFLDDLLLRIRINNMSPIAIFGSPHSHAFRPRFDWRKDQIHLFLESLRRLLYGPPEVIN